MQPGKGFPGDGWEGLSFIPTGEGSSEQAEAGPAGVCIPVPEPDTSPHPPWASNNNLGAGRALLLLDAGVRPGRWARKAISRYPGGSGSSRTKAQCPRPPGAPGNPSRSGGKGLRKAEPSNILRSFSKPTEGQLAPNEGGR